MGEFTGLATHFFKWNESTPEQDLIIDHWFSYKQVLTQIMSFNVTVEIRFLGVRNLYWVGFLKPWDILVCHMKNTENGHQNTTFVTAFASWEWWTVCCHVSIKINENTWLLGLNPPPPSPGCVCVFRYLRKKVNRPDIDYRPPFFRRPLLESTYPIEPTYHFQWRRAPSRVEPHFWHRKATYINLHLKTKQ